VVRAAGLVSGLGTWGGENPDPNPKPRPKHGVQKRQHVVNFFAPSAWIMYQFKTKNKIQSVQLAKGLGA
jgi:hypothetical protein